MVNYCDRKAAWIHWFPLWVKSHLFLWWLWRVLISVQPVALSPLLGSGSAAQLASPQGRNHLRHHLLITEGCLDYHTAFNGTLPYDEYHNPQHKWHCYTFCVPSQSASSLISPQKTTPPSLHPCGLLNPSMQYKLSWEIWRKWKKTKQDAYCALIVMLFCSTRH